MMVVATRAEEGRIGTKLSHHRETEYVSIERDNLRDRSDLEMNVPHDGPVGEAGERLRLWLLQLTEQALHVEWQCGQPLADLALPDLAGRSQ